jgi:hypothetical protein
VQPSTAACCEEAAQHELGSFRTRDDLQRHCLGPAPPEIQIGAGELARRPMHAPDEQGAEARLPAHLAEDPDKLVAGPGRAHVEIRGEMLEDRHERLQINIHIPEAVADGVSALCPPLAEA